MLGLFLCRDRGIRTPTNGFGDRYSTLKLCPCFDNGRGRKFSTPTALSFFRQTEKLVENLSYLTSTYCATTLADSETKLFVHCDF